MANFDCLHLEIKFETGILAVSSVTTPLLTDAARCHCLGLAPLTAERPSQCTHLHASRMYVDVCVRYKFSFASCVYSFHGYFASHSPFQYSVIIFHDMALSVHCVIVCVSHF